jgi:hypothetical protein
MERVLLFGGRMTITPRRLFLPCCILGVTSIAHAHPGHDGHELTWDMQHLAAHPAATLLCFTMIAAGIWALTQGLLVVRRRFTRTRR